MLEIEAKFYVAKPDAMRATVLAAGATLKKERVFEKNILFDNDQGELRRKGSVLRLRQDAQVRLTYKGIPAEAVQSQVRVREEVEMAVSDFDSAETLLQRIGYHPQMTYEKYRETFQLGDIEIVLDKLPYGHFIELEGPEAAIEPTAKTLGLNWEKRIVDSYLALMATLKITYHLPFNDLTFDNFEKTDARIADIISLFEHNT